MGINDLDFTDLYLFDTAPMIKSEGKMKSLPEQFFEEADQLRSLVIQKFVGSKNEQFTVAHKGQRYRVVVYECVGSEDNIYEATLRKVKSGSVNWSSFGFPKNYLPRLLFGTNEDVNKPVMRSGLILIGGKSDSGKTTTAYALIEHILMRMPWFAITIEDPPERILRREYPSGATIRQREVSSHNFDDALSTALRSNCDLIFVGEIRTKEGAELALSAAQTGHIVITTIHASDLSSCFDRFISVLGRAEHSLQSLSQVFRGAIWQGLESKSAFSTRSMVTRALFADTSVRACIREGVFQKVQSLSDMQQRAIEMGRELS